MVDGVSRGQCGFWRILGAELPIGDIDSAYLEKSVVVKNGS